jgi:hypothetical protein
MKKLTIKKIKAELAELQADPFTEEVILSVVQQHNDLVQDYNNDDRHQQYLLYQLKQQLHKMMMDLKKANSKQKATTKESTVNDFITNINKKKIETRSK